MATSSSIIRTEPPLPWSVRGRVKTAASDIDCLSHGKLQLELGSLARLGVHADLACMLLNDSVGDGQAQARATRLALTRGVFGGEERVINPVDVLRRDAAAAVTDVDLHGITVDCGDAQRPTLARHGVLSVEEQVQKHLLQLACIAMDERQCRIELRLNLDVRGLELVLHQSERFRDDFVEINGAELSGAGA